MQKKVLIRLIFVVVIFILGMYYVTLFQKHLRSASNPLDFLTSTTDGILKVNNGTAFLTFLQQDSLPIHDALQADWNLWMKWQNSNPEVGELMNDQSVFWVHMKDAGWCLFFPLPDRWGEDQINHLISGIPHLRLWESCLVWSGRGVSSESWQLMSEEGANDWKLLFSKTDEAAPFSYAFISNQSKIVLDYTNGEWLGIVEDNDWFTHHQPLQLQDSLLGSASSTLWLASESGWRLHSDEEKKRVFPLDTLYQCNVIESWMSWQGEQWKYQTYDGVHWVASQRFSKNPFRLMSAFLRDTNSTVVVVPHPEWMPQFGDVDFLFETKYLAKKKGKIYLSNDSLSILKAIQDTNSRKWTPDFNGYSENRYAVFEGQLKVFSSMEKFKLNDWIPSHRVGIVVLKNKENWLVRIAPITK